MASGLAAMQLNANPSPRPPHKWEFHVGNQMELRPQRATEISHHMQCPVQPKDQPVIMGWLFPALECADGLTRISRIVS